MKTLIIDNLVSKHRRDCYGYNIVHSARAFYFYRYELSVETAGGSYTAGGFRTKKDALECQKRQWPGRVYRVWDKWKSLNPEMLADTKILIRLMKWRNYSSIHDAPLSLPSG